MLVDRTAKAVRSLLIKTAENRSYPAQGFSQEVRKSIKEFS